MLVLNLPDASSVVRSAADANNRNKRVSFKPDVNKLDAKLSPGSRNNHAKQKIRGPNDCVSDRMRSKLGRIN